METDQFGGLGRWGKIGESVVPVQKNWPGAKREWASLLDLGERQIGESVVPVQKTGPGQGGNGQVWWTWARGKIDESVVRVHKSWPGGRWEWTNVRPNGPLNQFRASNFF